MNVRRPTKKTGNSNLQSNEVVVSIGKQAESGRFVNGVAFCLVLCLQTGTENMRLGMISNHIISRCLGSPYRSVELIFEERKSLVLMAIVSTMDPRYIAVVKGSQFTVLF